MNKTIENLYAAIAREIYAARPEEEWVEATHQAICITDIMRENCSYLLNDGSQKWVAVSCSELIFELRQEMAKMNNNGHAWYAATCKLSAAGKFKFEFDYDHLPAFSIIPSPNKWVFEFEKYPRPELQLQIQDWINGNTEPEVIVERLRSLRKNKDEVKK